MCISANIYNELQSCFIVMRFSYARKLSHEEIEEKATYYKKVLAPYYTKLKNNISNNDNHVLVYCIDTVFDLMDNGDCKKIHTFLDSIHNMTEICTGARALATFGREINGFRKKYGYDYFPFFPQPRQRSIGK